MPLSPAPFAALRFLDDWAHHHKRDSLELQPASARPVRAQALGRIASLDAVPGGFWTRQVTGAPGLERTLDALDSIDVPRLGERSSVAFLVEKLATIFRSALPYAATHLLWHLHPSRRFILYDTESLRFLNERRAAEGKSRVPHDDYDLFAAAWHDAFEERRADIQRTTGDIHAMIPFIRTPRNVSAREVRENAGAEWFQMRVFDRMLHHADPDESVGPYSMHDSSVDAFGNPSLDADESRLPAWRIR